MSQPSTIENAARLLEALAEVGDWPLTAHDIARMCDVHYQTALGWLTSLADNGRIHRRYYGRTAAFRPLSPAEEAERRRLLATGNPLDELVAKGLMADHDHASDNGVAR